MPKFFHTTQHPHVAYCLKFCYPSKLLVSVWLLVGNNSDKWYITKVAESHSIYSKTVYDEISYTQHIMCHQCNMEFAFYMANYILHLHTSIKSFLNHVEARMNQQAIVWYFRIIQAAAELWVSILENSSKCQILVQLLLSQIKSIFKKSLENTLDFASQCRAIISAIKTCNITQITQNHSKTANTHMHPHGYSDSSLVYTQSIMLTFYACYLQGQCNLGHLCAITHDQFLLEDLQVAKI